MDCRMVCIFLVVFYNTIYGFSSQINQRISTVIQRTGIVEANILPTLIFLEHEKESHNEVLDLFSLFIVGLSYTKEFDKGVFEDLLKDLHTFVIEHDYEYKKAIFFVIA